MTRIEQIRAALELSKHAARIHALAGLDQKSDEALATLAALETEVSQLLADIAERDARIADCRAEFSGLCHTLSVGSEGRPEMTAADWRKRVDQGIEFLIRPLQERAERAEAELALAREHIARSDEHHQAAAIAMTENLRAEVIRLASKIVQLQKESK